MVSESEQTMAKHLHDHLPDATAGVDTCDAHKPNAVAGVHSHSDADAHAHDCCSRPPAVPHLPMAVPVEVKVR